MSFNIARVTEALARAHPDRPAIVTADRTLTTTDLMLRTRRLGSALARRGFGAHRERSELAGHESGQDHLAIYLHNGPEYIEAMLGAYKGRLAPLNVNYRYVADELRYLLDDSQARVIVFHDRFSETLAEVLPDLESVRLLVQVPDDSDAPLLPGAVRYEDLLAEGSEDPVELDWSPDDLYILYTGGTTGMPKGVLWRQHDIFIAAMGGRPFGQAEAHDSIESIVEAAANGGAAMMSVAPLMHGAAQWASFNAQTMGNHIVFPRTPDRLDPAAIWRAVAEHRVISLQIVGDAMGRPLLDELERGDHDTSGLFALVSGGAAMNESLKARFLDLVPHAVVLDAVGASETGAQMGHTSSRGDVATGTFTPGPETVVVDATLTRQLEPGSDETGWLAQRGHVPLGYLGDAEKTAATFPVIDGIRFAIPGDRANWLADGMIELLGRDSVTINSGGEKIFAEEVEQALAQHPAVYDVVVVGRPSERWGSEVVAVVQLADGADVAIEDLLEEASQRIARYKLPKAVIVRDEIRRSPAGKADYRWAREQAVEAG